MQTEGFMLSEIGQTETNPVWSHLYVESKINKTELTDTENKLLAARSKGLSEGAGWNR